MMGRSPSSARRIPALLRRGGRSPAVGGGSTELLDLVAGGTFARAAVTYPQTSATTVVEVASGARAFEDLGAAEGSLLSLERQWTQLVANPRDILGSGWTAGSGGGPSADAGAGPDGAALADRSVVLGTGTSFSRFQTLTVVNGSVYTGRIWHRAFGGTSARQWTLFNGAASGQFDYAASVDATWRRRDLTHTSSSTSLSLTLHEGRPLAFGTITAAGDVLTDFANVGLGRYPLRTSAVSAGTVAPDTLVYAGGSYDARIATGTWSVSVYPKWATTELVSGDERWIVSFGGANDGLRFRHDGTGLRVEAVDGGSVVAASQYIGTWARNDEHRITINIAAGVITHNGTVGPTGSAITWSAASNLRIGGIQGAAAGSGNELDARIATPRASAASVVPSVAFVGDSITLGTGSSGTSLGGYRRVCRNAWVTDGYARSIVPYGEIRDASFAASDHSGVGGETAAQIETRFSASFGAGTARTPGVVFVMCGMNNAASDVLRDAFINTDYYSLIETIHLALPSAKIIVTTITPTSDGSYAPRVAAMNAALPGIWDDLEAAYPALATQMSRIDLSAPVGWAYSDAFHPNNTGYSIIGATINAAVYAALELP